jgi:sulfur carrier protein
VDQSRLQPRVQPQPAGSGQAVIVNGRPTDWSPNLSVDRLLKDLGLGNPAIAIEVNGELVPRSEISSRTLQPGDQVEIVTLTGGG